MRPGESGETGIHSEISTAVGNIRFSRKGKRLDNPVMLTLPGGTKSGGRQGRLGRLKGRIISDGQPPVGAQAAGLGFTQVAFRERQKIGYLLPAGFMREEPPALEPIV